MRIVKSSRHSKTIGDFGESLVCNWLSRSGFEVVWVDHTGIDLIAYSPSAKRRLGITVKSRTRTRGKEEEPVHIFVYGKRNDRKRLLDACKAFACEPWIAVYVETVTSADIYLTSLENYDMKYRGKAGRARDAWKMKRRNREEYDKDPNVMHMRIKFHVTNWDWHQR